MTPNQTIALYHPMLNAIAYKMVKCKADAEDIVQETLLKWLSIDPETIRNTKAYLIGAVTNNCLSHLDSLRKKKEQYMESMDLAHIKGFFKELDFSHLDLQAELSAALTIVHTKLEPLEKAVYLLKEVFDVDYESLQVLLGKKKEHCRQLLCRARKNLGKDVGHDAVKTPKGHFIENFKKACDLGQISALINDLTSELTPMRA